MWNQNYGNLENWCKTNSIKTVPGTLKALPDPKFFQISFQSNVMTFHLAAPSTYANMQSNEAAFEGWILALYHPLKTILKKVVLDWANPQNNSPINNYHYNRFLYRVLHFESVFGVNGQGWLDIAPNARACLNASTFIQKYQQNGQVFLVNQPSSNSSGPRGIVPKNSNGEAYLECLIDNQKVLHNNNTIVGGRQWPVGLFDETANGIYTANSRIFTGSKSALDLWTVEVNKINLYELKCPNNNKVGIFSELWFYAFFVRDILDGKIVDGMPKNKSSNPYKFTADVLGKMMKPQSADVHAYFLVSRLHPALTDILMHEVNSCLQQQKKQIQFGLATYTQDPLQLTSRRIY